MTKQAVLVLEDGEIFTGTVVTGKGVYMGEVVFNTALTGYPQSFTDPSYKGQIITMAYPLIGNYGIDSKFWESETIQPTAVLAKDVNTEDKDFINWFAKSNVPLITEFDTRKLIKKLSKTGVLKGALICDSKFLPDVLKELREFTMPNPVPLVSPKTVTVKTPPKGKFIKTCVLINCGCKKSIISKLLEEGCKVIEVPYNYPAKEILKFNPDFVLISNGPGDPQDQHETIKTIQDLVGKVPIYGICLGCQMIALAFSGSTYKLKYGHRGINHPVLNLKSESTFITSQNHGYAVSEKGLPKELKVTFRHLNDGSVEGISHKRLKIEGVQFHPEAAPGPLEAQKIFKEWVTG